MKPRITDLLDAAVVPGFSRIGYEVRSRISNWENISSFDCDGKTFVITGPTAGLGRETALQLATTGAHLVLVARNAQKVEAFADELRQRFSNISVHVVVADMGNLQSVMQAAKEISSCTTRIDALIHNAGALLAEREVGSDGREVTVSTHVLGPHLMTTLLLNVLRSSHGRVITVSSGGMYAASLPHPDSSFTLELTPSAYDGSKQYALAKRAQVTLNEMWAQREPLVSFFCMHPGWADTPGVQTSLPLFRRVTKPILRTPAQGADTIAWLAAAPVISAASGTFWSDREVRSIHKTPQTRKSDSDESRKVLWSWCDAAIAPYCEPDN